MVGPFESVVFGITFSNQVIADDISITASGGLNLQTAGEGDIIGNAGLISFTVTGSMNWRANGNLAALGGAYVLNDDYNNPYKDPKGTYREYFQNLINENTDAIELVAIGDVGIVGDAGVNFYSNKGNINFRAIRNIRYIANPTNGRISFFNVQSEAIQRPRYGQTRQFPLNRSNDYCNVGNNIVTCAGLSTMINKMVDTLVWYGILLPSAAFSPIVPPNYP